eukprot:4135645-Pleurochrysis_carterae.AAC.1
MPSPCAAMQTGASTQIRSGLAPNRIRNGARSGHRAAGARALIGTKTAPSARRAAIVNLQSPTRAKLTRVPHLPLQSPTMTSKRTRTQL